MCYFGMHVKDACRGTDFDTTMCFIMKTQSRHHPRCYGAFLLLKPVPKQLPDIQNISQICVKAVKICFIGPYLESKGDNKNYCTFIFAQSELTKSLCTAVLVLQYLLYIHDTDLILCCPTKQYALKH